MALTYYISSINGSAGTDSITVNTGTTYYSKASNYTATFKDGSVTYIANAKLQSQLAATSEKLNNGTGNVNITVYLLVAKSATESTGGRTLYVNWSQPALKQSGSYVKSGTSAQKNFVSDILVEPQAPRDSIISYTFTVAPSSSVTVQGVFFLKNSSGSSAGDLCSPTVTFKSPVSTSDKMTMTFKTSKSSVSGQSTWSLYSGGKVTCPSVVDLNPKEPSDGYKTVYLYFNSNGGSSIATKTGTAKTRTTITYNFKGWDNGKQANDEVNIENKDVWAVWEELSRETTVTSKASFSGFETPTRSGYKFAGWYKDDGAKVSSISTDENMTLYAKWYPIMTFASGTDSVRVSKSTIENVFEGESTSWPSLYKNSYDVTGTTNVTISYNSNGGSTCAATVLSCNSKISYVAKSNWYTTSGADTGISIGGYAVVRAGSFIAQWTQGSTTITEKAIGTLPTPTRMGYTFKEWQYNGIKVTATTKFSSNATLVAVWTPITYTITFNLNSTTSAITPTKIDNITKTYGINTTLPSTVPTYNDNSRLFKCWQINNYTYSVGQSIGDDFYVTGTSKYELVAQWSEVPHYVDFIYYNGSWKNPDRQWYDSSMITSSLIWKMSAPVWEDHSFVGWTTQLPNNFWNTYGVYESVDDIETSVANNLISSYTVSITDKERYLPWDNKDNIPKYYGIWVKTGKKIKVQPSSESTPTWVDVQSMYVKTGTGWKRVTDTWIKTASGWKHEI